MAADFRHLTCERLSFWTPSVWRMEQRKSEPAQGGGLDYTRGGPPWHPDGSRGETKLLCLSGGAWRSSGGSLGPASVNAGAARDVGARIRRGLR